MSPFPAITMLFRNVVNRIISGGNFWSYIGFWTRVTLAFSIYDYQFGFYSAAARGEDAARITRCVPAPSLSGLPEADEALCPRRRTQKMQRLRQEIRRAPKIR